MQSVHNYRNEAAFLQIGHAVTKGTHTGQDNFFGSSNHILVRGDHRLTAYSRDGITHAIQIAHAIIYNCNFITHLFAPL